MITAVINQSKITSDSQINQAVDAINIQLERDYFPVWNIKNSLIFCTEKTLGFLLTLLNVYESRPDLQSAFPEVANGSYMRLLSWAGTSGISSDSANIILSPYASVYKLMTVYNGRPDLQSAFPEATNGSNLERLFSWANAVVSGGVMDSSSSCLGLDVGQYVAPPSNPNAICYITDQLPGSVEGYHNYINGIPISMVISANTVAFSHEILEMTTNPTVSIYIYDNSSSCYITEICDAVNGSSYSINGISVSNFVYPSWFSSSGKIPFDYTNQLVMPFQLSVMGYITKFTMSNPQNI